MASTAFATSRPLQQDELDAAPVRYPRASELAKPLALQGAKTQQAAQTLGLNTIADLLEHLPRDRREARAVAELAVRRRGMRLRVEATVAEPGGAVKAAFFNQPWLVQRYPTGTRLVLHG